MSNKNIKYSENASINSPLNGAYTSTNKNESLFKELNKTFTKDSSKILTQIDVISENILKIKLVSDSFNIDSIYIRGKLTDSSFRLNTKRNLSLFNPIIWNYNIDDNYIKMDNNGRLTLSNYSRSFAFFTILPVIATNGSFSYHFKKI